VKLLIVGNRGGTNVGGCLEKGAEEMGLMVRVLESRLAMEAPAWLRRANWWLRGRRPTRLKQFSQDVVEQCREWKPEVMISTGMAPLIRDALDTLGGMGVKRLNYLTDDPWNPAHRAEWFEDALPRYDVVYSPRRANMGDLRTAGVPAVSYLAFGYNPDLHFEERSCGESAATHDVIFAGGGDRDRVPLIAALIRAGFGVALYGSLWERYPETRGCTRGQADFSTLRRAHADARVALCLVRRANRDGHSMRTFEVAAMGSCVLAEYTDEHREILGADGEAVVYFRTQQEMIDRLRWLLDHPEERRRLRAAVRARITGGRNTYRDRLETMLAVAKV